MYFEILTALKNDPPELDFVLPGFLAGTVGTIVAPGATSKSFWALEAAMSIACSVAGGDLIDLQPSKTGRVVYLAGQDPAPAFINRIHSIGKHLSSEAKASIAQNLVVESIMGNRFDLMNETDIKHVIECSQGSRLIVLDPCRLDVNDNVDVTSVLSVLEHVARQTGSSVLFLLCNSQGDLQQTALFDKIQWCSYMANMTKKESCQLSDRSDRLPIGTRRHSFVRFGVYTKKHDATLADRWYQRHENGVLLPVQLQDLTTNRQKLVAINPVTEEESGEAGAANTNPTLERTPLPRRSPSHDKSIPKNQ